MKHGRKTILILAANPSGTDRLRLDQEVREMQFGLERSRRRDQFEIISRWAVRPDDLRRALLDYEPQIVHFCGHGAGEPGLLLENDLGQIHLVSSQALAGLFKFFQSKIECVVLNACYSEGQAEAISQHIHHVVGMSRGVSDRAALAFSIGFYDALVAGRSYLDAYELGCNAIALKNIPEDLTPQIKINQSDRFPIAQKSVPQSVPQIEPGPQLPVEPPARFPAPPPAALYSQAYQLYQAKRWQDVIRTLERIKTLDPTYPDYRELLPSAQWALKLAALHDRAIRSESQPEPKTALYQFEGVRPSRKRYRDPAARITRLKPQARLKPFSTWLRPALIWLVLAWALCWALIGSVAYTFLNNRADDRNLLVCMAFFGLMGGVVSSLIKQLVIIQSRSPNLKQIAFWAGVGTGFWMLVGFLAPQTSDIPSTAIIAAILSLAAGMGWQLFQPKSSA